MHNNSNICIIIPTMARQKKKKLFFLIMMSWWRHHLFHGLNNPGSSCTDLEKKKKFRQKKLCNFLHKQPIFRHQILIHQSWLKICTKTHKRRAIRNLSFRNSINWVPKNQKKFWIFLQKMFSTSLQHQFFFKMEN